MKAKEMQLDFEIKVGQFHNPDFPIPFQSHEIQDRLNEAQLEMTRRLHSEFEKTEKIRTELAPLIENVVFSSFVTGAAYCHTNGHVVDVPTGAFYPVEERCVVGYTDCNNTGATKTAKVLPLTHDEYTSNLNNPFRKPNKDIVWRMDLGASGSYNKRHEIITDGTITLNSYTMRYIKRPADINLVVGAEVDCELDESLHDEIVNLAVGLALRSRPVPQPVTQNQES